MYSQIRRGKREAIARGFFWSGITSLISALPPRDQLIVLNYHRIGYPDDDNFDPFLFSSTADELDQQLAYLKRRARFVSMEEVEEYVSTNHKDTSKGFRVLVTFDDGYLDNYKVAYPILQSHSVPAIFFLATSFVGTSSVPWWDYIAFMIRTARRSRFILSYPGRLDVDIERDGLGPSIRSILWHYKKTDNLDQPRFLRELVQEAQGVEPPQNVRRFLDWGEAREMIKGGMTIGSHTHSHPVLSQIPLEEQWRELTHSKTILEEKLGTKIHSISYPVGVRTAFDGRTEKLAEEAGYRLAYSFYGGINLPGKTRRHDVKRFGVDGQSLNRLCLQVAMCRSVGNFWP